MNITNNCRAYFQGFNDFSTWKTNDTKTNTLALLKITSYFTFIIPLFVGLTFGMTYGISALIGRVKIKNNSSPQDQARNTFFAVKILADQGNASAQCNLGSM